MRRKIERKRASRTGFWIFLIFLFAAFSFGGNDMLIQFEDSEPSKSVGSPAVGGLKHGKRLPTTGPNFETYSRLGSALGRTTLNDRVRKVVLTAYESLAETHPEHRWIYAETGWPSGGSFYPHKTHQNGMSVDFHVPVLVHDKPDILSAWPWDGFGYLHEFDEQGEMPAQFMKIDYEAMGAHLLALDKAAKANKLKISRVIFAPELQKQLRKTKSGKRALGRMAFSKKKSWVRHDEHYHVDFKKR